MYSLDLAMHDIIYITSRVYIRENRKTWKCQQVSFNVFKEKYQRKEDLFIHLNSYFTTIHISGGALNFAFILHTLPSKGPPR